MAHNWKRQASVAYGCALTRLALNFYLFFEELPEKYEDENTDQRALDGLLFKMAGSFLDGENKGLLEQLSSLRLRIQDEMHQAMAFSDGLQVYGYALNRVGRRFIQCLPIEVGEEALTANLMRYIGEAKEAAIQNQRIQMIMGQLPVRLTRKKYFGIVHDALTAYIGSDPAGLKDMMYLIKGCSMAGIFKEPKSGYARLYEIFSELRDISFKEMDKASYEHVRERVSEAGDTIMVLMEYYTSLQEMVNDLYILCLTGDWAVRDAKEEEHAVEILQGLRLLYEQGKRQIPQELTDCLPNLEGIQEEYAEKYQRLDFHWEDNQDAPGEEGEMARRGEMVDRLMSTSTFASLEIRKDCDSVTREDVEKAADLFFAEAEPVLSSLQKPVARGVMAMSLSYLPVFFNSPGEIGEYIRNSLACCTDIAEKEACMDLLLQVMESDGYELL